MSLPDDAVRAATEYLTARRDRNNHYKQLDFENRMELREKTGGRTPIPDPPEFEPMPNHAEILNFLLAVNVVVSNMRPDKKREYVRRMLYEANQDDRVTYVYQDAPPKSPCIWIDTSTPECIAKVIRDGEWVEALPRDVVDLTDDPGPP